MAILYLVSTPIGNLGDVTIRALETLWSVDVILCEDTRETQVLLNHYKDKFDTPYPRLLSYNDHNHFQRIPRIISTLSEGKNVALVTDRVLPYYPILDIS
jgi:16S rRNA (cytidine1402-2'-O)-methyltransferase